MTCPSYGKAGRVVEVQTPGWRILFGTELLSPMILFLFQQ
jgi:hypothetical protein